MSNICNFNLQSYVDDYNCAYYLEAGSDKNSIEHALKFTFFRIFSLDPRAEFIEEARYFYHFNPRIHLFVRTHEQGFYELAKMVPNEFNAVVWISDTQHHRMNQAIEQLAAARPAKTDVVIIDSKLCTELADFVFISKYFGLTHHIHQASLGAKGTGLVLIPTKLYKQLNNKN